MQAMGFPAYKMRPALGPERGPAHGGADARGHGAGLRPDDRRALLVAHGRPKLLARDGARLARALRRYEPTWLEEPLPPDDHDAYRALRAASASRSPPASTSRMDGFLDLIETGAADYIQMDVCCQGGLDWVRAIAARDRARAPAFRVPQLGHDARGARRGAHRHLLARVGGRVARVPVLRQRRARRDVSVRARRRDPRRAARDRRRRLTVPDGPGPRRRGRRDASSSAIRSSRPVVVLPHRFAAGDRRRHRRSQRQVG